MSITSKELEAVIQGQVADHAQELAGAQALRDEYKQRLAEHRRQHGC